ncbi:MAG: blue (type 1) copper domain protein [Solirubrobacterales bacterium]|nr:blue (type 1) copper domain protein [Solirubrobacterales bacterium]
MWSTRRAGAALLGGAVALAGLAAGPAQATSRKIAVGDFRWSPPAVTVSLGDTVTWIWTGPDTQHSITGLSANAVQYDSDPGRTPDHKLGDRFQVRFTAPGTYDFHCVLHGIVRGSVTVDPLPGGGAPSPDPDPPILGDAVPPVVDGVSVHGRSVRYTLDEAATVTVDVLKQKGARWVLIASRHFDGHVGFNEGLLRGSLTPGRYRAFFRAADADNNQSKDAIAAFRVRAPRGR